MGALRLIVESDQVIRVERPVGGGWASDGWELVCRLDRLAAANVCADLGDWLAGGVAAGPGVFRLADDGTISPV